MKTRRVLNIAIIAGSCWLPLESRPIEGLNGIHQSYDHSVSVLGLQPDPQLYENPVPVSIPLPAYPPELLRANLEGKVTLRFQINPDGTTSEVKVIEASLKEFGDPAKDAIAKWTFHPATDAKTKKSVAIWMRCQIVFKVED